MALVRLTSSAFPFKIAQASREDHQCTCTSQEVRSVLSPHNTMREPSPSQNMDMDSAQLRKDRNKIACRKSRKKRGEKLKRLQVQTEELEFKHLALRRRLIELQKSCIPSTYPRGTFQSTLNQEFTMHCLPLSRKYVFTLNTLCEYV